VIFKFDTRVVAVRDRVRTKSGRCGVVRADNFRSGTACIVWDDGDDFPLKYCHFEVLMHNAQFPDWYKEKHDVQGEEG
jgi:hypothetical protein